MVFGLVTFGRRVRQVGWKVLEFNSEVYLEPSGTSMMERFAKIGNYFCKKAAP